MGVSGNSIALKSFQSYMVNDGLLAKTVEAIKAGEKEARTSGTIQSFEVFYKGFRQNIAIGRIFIIPPSVASKKGQDFPTALLYGCLVRTYGGEEMSDLISHKIGDSEFDEYSQADYDSIKEDLFGIGDGKFAALILFAPHWVNKREYIGYHFTKDDNQLSNLTRHLVFSAYFDPRLSSAFNAMMTDVDTSKFDVTDITPKINHPALAQNPLQEFPLLVKQGSALKKTILLSRKTADDVSKQELDPQEINVFDSLDQALRNSMLPETEGVEEASEGKAPTKNEVPRLASDEKVECEKCEGAGCKFCNQTGVKKAEYQPKTGQPCSCKPGQQRDNCPQCEGTGQKIDFAAIRNKNKSGADEAPGSSEIEGNSKDVNIFKDPSSRPKDVTSVPRPGSPVKTVSSSAVHETPITNVGPGTEAAAKGNQRTEGYQSEKDVPKAVIPTAPIGIALDETGVPRSAEEERKGKSASTKRADWDSFGHKTHPGNRKDADVIQAIDEHKWGNAEIPINFRSAGFPSTKRAAWWSGSLKKIAQKLDDFTQAYIVAALWSSNDNSDPSGGAPLDSNYDISDIAPSTLQKMSEDCAAFQQKNEALLNEAYQRPGYDGHGEWSSQEQAGHDFWLTRNGHGAGFWDRQALDEGGLGDRLTEAAKAFGEDDLYVGDDNKIYSSYENYKRGSKRASKNASASLVAGLIAGGPTVSGYDARSQKSKTAQQKREEEMQRKYGSQRAKFADVPMTEDEIFNNMEEFGPAPEIRLPGEGGASAGGGEGKNLGKPWDSETPEDDKSVSDESVEKEESALENTETKSDESKPQADTKGTDSGPKSEWAKGRKTKDKEAPKEESEEKPKEASKTASAKKADDLEGYEVDIQAEKEAMLASGDAEECPGCGAVSAYSWDNVTYCDNCSEPVGLDLPEEDRIYHIGAASSFEWECGKCRRSWTPVDSPINAEVYTHRDPNAEFDMESSLNEMDNMLASDSKQAYGEEGMAPVFYECGSCGGYHPSLTTSQELGIDWNGDCRDPKGTMDPDTIYANHPEAQIVTLEDQMAPDFDDSVLAAADEPKTASPEGIAEQNCECSDPGCPAHQGVAQCLVPASCVLYRIDMEDATGTAFCDACSDDALDSGVFRMEEGEEPRLGEEEMNYFASAEDEHPDDCDCPTCNAAYGDATTRTPKTADVADNDVSEGSDSGNGGAGDGKNLSPTVQRHEQYNEKQANVVVFKTAAGELPAKRIKRIPSHSGKFRYMETLQDTGEGIPRIKEIPSPYAYSPEHTVYRTPDGREVFIVETRHKTYDVFEVPPGTPKHPLNSDFADKGTGMMSTEGQEKEGAASWQGSLQENYDNNFEQFQSYDEVYNLAQRLGFNSAEEAWAANPMIQGGTDPADFSVVGSDVSGDVAEAKSEVVSPDTVDSTIKQPTESVEEAGKRASAIDGDVAQARKAVDADKKALTSDSASTDTVNPAHFAAEQRHDDVPVSQGDIPTEKEPKSDLLSKGAPEAHDVPPQADSKVADDMPGATETGEFPYVEALAGHGWTDEGDPGTFMGPETGSRVYVMTRHDGWELYVDNELMDSGSDVDELVNQLELASQWVLAEKTGCAAYGDEEDEERPFDLGLGDLADLVVEKETDDGEK